VTFRIPKVKSTIKAGGTNIINNSQLEYAGGPTIGALYYVAITVDRLLNDK
jgi:iron complex outermembrane receptor protein